MTIKITFWTLLGYMAFAVSLLAALAYAQYAIPICWLSTRAETTIRVVSWTIMFLLILPVMLYANSLGRKRARKYVPMIFFIFLCSVPLFLISTARMDVVEFAHWHFDGPISNKYLSSNHDEESLTINGVNYEAVPSNIWDQVKVGDKLVKKSCSNVIQINRRNVRAKMGRILNLFRCCPADYRDQ